MCCKEWKRARNSNQKDHRINDILDAASRLFHNEEYEKVTMIMIAKEANFTRSNLYRYFSTKEEIFLSLYTKDIIKWQLDIIKNISGQECVEEFVNKWTAILMKQKRLLELSPYLALNLEKNSSRNVYIEVKKTIKELTIDLIPLLSKILPSLRQKDLIDLLLTSQVLVAGLWPMCNYSQMQLDVLNSLELDSFQLEFETFFNKAFTAYIVGLLKK